MRLTTLWVSCATAPDRGRRYGTDLGADLVAAKATDENLTSENWEYIMV